MKRQQLTVFATCVEIFNVVIEADSDGGKAQLSLQPSHQTIIQRLGPFCSDHGADGPKHPSVADVPHCLLLSLNLGSHIVLKVKTSFTEQQLKNKWFRKVKKFD